VTLNSEALREFGLTDHGRFKSAFVIAGSETLKEPVTSHDREDYAARPLEALVGDADCVYETDDTGEREKYREEVPHARSIATVTARTNTPHGNTWSS
jgi:hypothetical protein